MSIEAMKQALEALEFDGFTPEDATHRRLHGKAITSLRTAIEQALTQGEPVKDRLDFWALFDENQRLRAELKFKSAPQPQRPDDDSLTAAYMMGRADDTILLRQCLDALEGLISGAEAMGWSTKKASDAVTTLKERLKK